MSWSRFDDTYDTHPKLLALGDGDKGDARRHRWTRIIIYTNRHGSPQIPWNVGETIARVNRKFLQECVAIGLAELQPDGTLIVHDWPLYADIPTPEKVAYYLKHKNPGASANEVARAIGGRRSLVLQEIERHRTTTRNGNTQEPHQTHE